jgi:hypothetical protein
MRYPAGFIRPGFDPLKNPDAPTAVSGTAGNTSVSVSFTAPANAGGSAISEYQAVAYTGGTYVSNTAGASSPITVTGLTNDTTYTFQVWALNTYGPGPFSQVTGGVTPSFPQRAIWFGGAVSGTVSNVISYIDITTTGNATSFGQLTTVGFAGCAFASSTRGVYVIGGSNAMQYVTIATTGNATSFGEMNYSDGRNQTAACNSATRGVVSGGTFFSGGNNPVAGMNYVTIASTGNGTTFGSMAIAKFQHAGCASPTRGVFTGGQNGSSVLNVMTYITIATTGNDTSFGNLVQPVYTHANASNATRGILAGNYGGVSQTDSNVITYITIASTGDATTFGSLITGRRLSAAASGLTRVVIGGGQDTGSGAILNSIEYVTIASTGNAVSFGNLPAPNYYMSATSSSNGGVQ